ncbi:unnamed protein product [Mycena citricolor]|uniref:Prenyltransferase alpha-alpha toroid domain-containing protein n=1 Tax=Mycena citricolor TaxID=2018698 RepID=A0AAD2K1P6_9AGAR|nr:unnamed protein product [Mycena citricolor]
MSKLLPELSKAFHAGHVNRCLTGLPGSHVEYDASRMAVGFYCIGALDLLGLLEKKTTPTDRRLWKEWIWEQQIHGPVGSGFRPSPFVTPYAAQAEPYDAHNGPHLVMSYTAILTLAILRDDFAQLDRPGLVTFVRSCQRADGSFAITPGSNECDLRSLYCAFAICDMLGDWSGIDVARSLEYISRCRTYEGGYGQDPFCEASGGPTYIALASLHLATRDTGSPLTSSERHRSIHWLVHNQEDSGGFRGRTGKTADACYSFWCGAGLKLLGASDLVDAESHASFIASCQFKFGGICKFPGETPDPYHTYLAMASLALYPPSVDISVAASWKIAPIDALLNATEDTVRWIRHHVPAPRTVG